MEGQGNTRIFVCRNCGNVVVQRKGDKRTVFCSGHCAVLEKTEEHAGEKSEARGRGGAGPGTELQARSLRKIS